MSFCSDVYLTPVCVYDLIFYFIFCQLIWIRCRLLFDERLSRVDMLWVKSWVGILLRMLGISIGSESGMIGLTQAMELEGSRLKKLEVGFTGGEALFEIEGNTFISFSLLSRWEIVDQAQALGGVAI